MLSDSNSGTIHPFTVCLVIIIICSQLDLLTEMFLVHSIVNHAYLYSLAAYVSYSHSKALFDILIICFV